MLTVHELEWHSAGRWDAFVSASPEATFFHRAGWKQVLDRSFGHPTYYYYAEREGRICGVIPLAHIRSWLFGNALISTPFCVYGGIVAEDDATRNVLEEKTIEVARELNVDYLELRNQTPYQPKWTTKDLYVIFRKEIDPDPDNNLLAIPRKQRRMIRQGIKAGLVSKIDTDVNRFYDIYAASVRNLGTPVFSKKYFRILQKVFGPDCEVLTITHNGRPISSVMSFYFRDTVLPYYGGGLPEARAVAGNDFMYWELMRRAGERGVRIFDYGRSKKGTGSYSFKIHWGFEPEPLHYEYLLLNAESTPDISPLNPRYRLLVQLWKHMPLSLTKLLGPLIARNLG
ncbi:MAG: FemAB family XrtA/PEP-CTERM system-associated protein [Acidiferrobacterales bacterium]